MVIRKDTDIRVDDIRYLAKEYSTISFIQRTAKEVMNGCFTVPSTLTSWRNAIEIMIVPMIPKVRKFDPNFCQNTYALCIIICERLL